LNKLIKNNNYLWLFLVFVLAISIRWFYVTVLYDDLLKMRIVQISPDTLSYQSIAWRMLETLDYGKDLDRPPLYPHFLYVFYFLFGHAFKEVREVQAILDTLTCIILALTAKNLFNNKAGLITGLCSAFYPFFILQTAEIMTETLFLFLFSSFVLFLLYQIGRAHV